MTRPRISTPDAVIVAVALALAATAIAVGDGTGSGGAARGGAGGGSGATAAVVREVATIARRDELIRGLRFKRVPRPLVVTPAETRRESLAELDRQYPAARRRTDQELIELLGLVPPGTDLRAVEGDVSGGEVAGYYDTRRKRLAIVSGPASANRVLTEITLSHELNHALEDQRFGVHDNAPSGADDGATAYTALIEGTATAVMQDYTTRFIAPGAALTSAFAALGPSEAAAKSVPPYIQRSLEFSYTGGERFVQALRDAAHSWKLVNFALAKRPPVSTEQVIHPEKYMAFERPLPVRIGRLGLGRGWKRASAGTIGELDTRELLRVGIDSGTAASAAAGWGGGRYELWTNRGAAASCPQPCRRADALVLRWRWDSPLDAREFDAALPLYVLRGLQGVASGAGGRGGAGAARWRLRAGGGAAIAVGPGRATTLAFAPSPEAAARLARR